MELQVENPATLDIIREVSVPDYSEIDTMMNNSRPGFLKWSQQSLGKRQAALSEAAGRLLENKEQLARLLTMEVGKPLLESQREVQAAASVFRLYSEMSFGSEELVNDGSRKITVEKEPYGVCALILPWNYPLGLLAWKLAPCLLAGNTALVKPSEHAPLAVMEAISLISYIFPAGAVQAVPGGGETGQYLSQHPSISRLSFTGSRKTGSEILKAGGRSFPHITLEMGGNDPAIILPDCNLDNHLDRLFLFSFFNAGQICVAIKRIYVHESLEERLVNGFVRRADELKAGDGLEPETRMGPLNNPGQLQKVRGLVEDAVSRGATINAGGKRIDRPGHFHQPTVLSGLDDEFPIVKEEQFGPAIPILAYSDIEDAIARANDSDYGLGGSVWTSDIARGRETASRLECGTAWVNAHMLVEHRAPFGGWKQSGSGRELGKKGLEEFLQTRTVYCSKPMKRNQ